MNKLLVLFLLLSGLCLSSILPIVNNDRCIWMFRDSNIVEVESPFVLGFANPTVSKVDVLVEFNGFDVDISNVFVYNGIALNLTDKLTISGFGVGNIVSNINVTGCGYMDIYENGVYQGSFVPEPMTIILLGLGLIGVIRE